MFEEDRAPLIKNMLTDLELEDPSRIKEIKQCEMFTKWGPLLKPENAAITCPKPPLEVLECNKKRIAEKSKARAEAKRNNAKKLIVLM
eukprot:6073941-Ditylum_brightwellii.AAC.1